MPVQNDPTRPTSSAPAGAKPASNQVTSPLLDARTLPQTGDAALGLASGSRYELFSGGSKLEVNKLDANQIQVSLDGAKKNDKKSFILDLKNPQAQRAYEDLVQFKATKADMMSSTPKKTGVTNAAKQPSKLEVKGDGGVDSAKRSATGKVDVSKGGARAGATLNAQQKPGGLAAGGEVRGGGTVQRGEAELSGDAAVRMSKGSTRTVDAAGNKAMQTTEGRGYTASGGIADKTGPNQYSVSGKYQQDTTRTQTTDASGKTSTQVTQTVSSQQDLGASTQKTMGEAAMKGAATFQSKNDSTVNTGPGGTTRSDTRATTASANAGISDTTGPTQYGANAGASRSETTKVDTAADGKTTTTRDLTTDLKADGNLQGNYGQEAVSAKGGFEQKTVSNQVTDSNGVRSGTATTTVTSSSSLGVKDETGPNQHRASGSMERTTVTQVTTGPGGTTTQFDDAGKATAGAGITRGKNSASVDFVQQWKQAAGTDSKGLRSQSGQLTRDLDLTSTVAGRKVGFGNDSTREYTFTLPKDSTGTPPLPTDSASALKMPEGATFEMNAKGKVALNSEGDGFKGGMTDERQVGVKIERGPGSAVKATVSFAGKDNDAEGFDRKLGDDKKGRSVTIGASHSHNKTENRVDQLSLDLSRPGDRQAYDALMRGNLGPAQALAARSGSSKIDTAESSELKGKIGVSFDKIGGSLELSRRQIDPKDAAIQGDPLRKSVTEAAQKEGKDVHWIEKGGAFEIGASPSGSVSTGPVSVSFGFEAKRALAWRSMGPEVNGQGGAPGASMSADQAASMPAGSEFQIGGSATVSGRAGVMAGWQEAVPGVKVSAGVGFDVSKGKSVDMNVQVRKLDANVVEVRLDELDKSQQGHDFSARIGADVKGAELAKAGGSLLGAIPKNPEIAGALAGVNKSLSAEFKIGSSETKQDGKGLKFTLDLSKPEARAAYEKLVRGNPESALDLADRKGAGVDLQTSIKTASDEKEKHVDAHIGDLNLYSSKQVRTDTTTEVTQSERTERLDSSIADRKQSSIWGRDRHVDVQAVSVRTPEAPNGTKWLKFSFEEKDRFTSEDELKSRRDLAKELGAEPTQERIDKSKAEGRGIVGFISGARNDYGKLQTAIEVVITDKGISQIRGAGREGALQAFAQVQADKNGTQLPRWAEPKGDARTLLDGYRNATIPATRDANRKAYEAQFGKDEFKQDVKDYARAVDFSDAVQKGSDDADPAAWNKAFADQAKRAGFNFFDGLGAMDKMAGDDQVLVQKFSVHGKAVDLEMKSEGDLGAPQLSKGAASVPKPQVRARG